MIRMVAELMVQQAGAIAARFKLRVVRMLGDWFGEGQ